MFLLDTCQLKVSGMVLAPMPNFPRVLRVCNQASPFPVTFLGPQQSVRCFQTASVVLLTVMTYRCRVDRSMLKSRFHRVDGIRFS